MIALDVDGVLRNFEKSLQRVYRAYYPGWWCEPVTNWKLAPFYEIGEEIERFAFVEHPWEVFAGAETYPGALEMVYRLKDLGADVFYLTTQWDTTRDATGYWLAQKGFAGLGAVCFARSEEEKARALDDYRADGLIDDGPHNLEAAQGAGYPVLCVDRAWNRDFQGSRARTWD